MDSGYNMYGDGRQVFGGTTWKSVYYRTVTSINPICDPSCTSDPYYKKYIIVWDPPPAPPPDNSVNLFEKAPGILVAGEHMNAQMAQTHVWDALVAAEIDMDPEIWNIIQSGLPDAAWQVNALSPSGAQWDYYLVPILSNTTTAIAFVQLAADDGSFEGIFVPDNPVFFTPVTMTQAATLARGTLDHGEHLTGGMLTWDPNEEAPVKKSPSFPYYEFGIFGAGNQDAGVVRVALNGAPVVRSE